MGRPILLFLLSITLSSIHCSCFTEMPWANMRPLLQLIDACPAIETCETECLSEVQCSAFAFVNSKCALLGDDSGKLDRCTSPNPTYWIRTTACDCQLNANFLYRHAINNAACPSHLFCGNRDLDNYVFNVVEDLCTYYFSYDDDSYPYDDHDNGKQWMWRAGPQYARRTSVVLITPNGSPLIDTTQDACGGQCVSPTVTATSAVCPANYCMLRGGRCVDLICDGTQWTDSNGEVVTQDEDLVFCWLSGPVSACGPKIYYASGATSIPPTFSATSITCPANYALRNSQALMGELNCVGGQWLDQYGKVPIPESPVVYCIPSV